MNWTVSGGDGIAGVKTSVKTEVEALDRVVLNDRQRSIIKIAAFTAGGEVEKLKPALADGLDAGLTINEISEILVQLYAYAGFPRSLNGLFAFMDVVNQRRAEGYTDSVGRDASPVPPDFNRSEYGAQVRAGLSGLESDSTGAEWQMFSPVMDTFLKEHLFADIFCRDVLTHKERELATVAALSNMTGTAGQLSFHLCAAMNIGITACQLDEFIEVLKYEVDSTQAERAEGVLRTVLYRFQ